MLCNFIAVHDCGDLWNTDTGNDTCGTDRTRSDTNFNCISSGINQCLCSSTGCNVSGDNLQIRVFCLDLLYGFQNVFGMTVCGIDNDDIDMGSNQGIDTLHHVSGDTDTGTAEKTSLIILCRKRILDLFFNIFDGDQTF